MRIFTYRLHGEPHDIAQTIGEVSSSFKAPLFAFPKAKGLDFENDLNIRYPGDMPILKTTEQILSALTPEGQGWSLKFPRLGVIRPVLWERDQDPVDDHGEIVGYFDFAPRPFRDQPSYLRLVEIESLSTFFESYVMSLRNIFEKRKFLRDIEDFSIRHENKRYADIEEDNRALVRQIEALKNEIDELNKIRKKVEKLERESNDDPVKAEQLQDLREQIFPTVKQLPENVSNTIRDERLNGLLQIKKIWLKDLSEMEKRQAYYGINAPLEVIHQIDYYKQKINEVDAEINALEGNP